MNLSVTVSLTNTSVNSNFCYLELDVRVKWSVLYNAIKTINTVGDHSLVQINSHVQINAPYIIAKKRLNTIYKLTCKCMKRVATLCLSSIHALVIIQFISNYFPEKGKSIFLKFVQLGNNMRSK